MLGLLIGMLIIVAACSLGILGFAIRTVAGLLEGLATIVLVMALPVLLVLLLVFGVTLSVFLCVGAAVLVTMQILHRKKSGVRTHSSLE